MSTHLDNHIRPLYQETISALDYIYKPIKNRKKKMKTMKLSINGLQLLATEEMTENTGGSVLGVLAILAVAALATSCVNVDKSTNITIVEGNQTNVDTDLSVIPAK